MDPFALAEEVFFDSRRRICDFSVDAALETALFRKRLGAEACLDIAQALQKGDRVKVAVNGKTVFVEVDLLRLVLFIMQPISPFQEPKQ